MSSRNPLASLRTRGAIVTKDPQRTEAGLAARFSAVTAKHRDRVPMIIDGEPVALGSLSDRASTVAAALAGIDAGSRIGVLSTNPAAVMAGVFGTLLAGATPAVCDPRWHPDELNGALDAAGVETLIVDETLQPRRVTTPRSNGEAGAVVLFTSGTTGTPKPVVQSQASLQAAMSAFAETRAEYFRGGPWQLARTGVRLLRSYRMRLVRVAASRQLRIVTPMRVHGISGFSLCLQAVLNNELFITSAGFHPRKFLRFVDEHRASVLACAPAHVKLMLRLPDFDRFDLSSLLLVALGGSLVPAPLAEEVRRRFGAAVAIGYGSTELGGGVTVTRLDDDPDRQVATVGRPFRRAAIRVVDDTGRELDPGEVGEILAWVDGVDGVEVSGDGGGSWRHTGDLGFLDAAGYLSVVGRRDELIIRGAEKLYPQEIEGVLEAHPAVSRAAVVGLTTDDVAGQRVVACVVLSGASGPDLDVTALRTYCGSRLTARKVPDEFRVVPSLPITEEGKIRRHVLAEQVSGPATAEV